MGELTRTLDTNSRLSSPHSQHWGPHQHQATSELSQTPSFQLRDQVGEHYGVLYSGDSGWHLAEVAMPPIIRPEKKSEPCFGRKI